jgi:ATP-dependent Clp protease ATP-binding subunit ClpC
VFERFTQPARQVLVDAQDEARTLGHVQIGTEHFLLGLLADPDSDASRVLDSLGVTAELVRERVLAVMPAGDRPTEGQLPLTPEAKRVLEFSLREALSLRQQNITPEHLLLGLTRDLDGLAMRVIDDLGTEGAAIRSALLPQAAATPARRFFRRSRPRIGTHPPDHA